MRQVQEEKIQNLLESSAGSGNENCNLTLKKVSDTPDPKVAKLILTKVARSLSPGQIDNQVEEAAALLMALEPKSPTEALLLGQFLALNDSGMRCLHLANRPDQGFYHVDKLFTLAHKLFNTANQTMQTVLKYRSGGQQTVQVVHVHNEGQAIVTQNLSSPQRAGSTDKISN